MNDHDVADKQRHASGDNRQLKKAKRSSVVDAQLSITDKVVYRVLEGDTQEDAPLSEEGAGGNVWSK